MASTYLTRTQVAGNRQIFTQSFWFKLSNTGDQTLISTFNDSNNYNYCYIDSSTQQLSLQWKKSGSVVAQKNTTRKFRDTSAWYHIVYAVDTTQASGGDRIKLYVNGVLETEFSSNIAPGQITTEVNDNGTTQYIGSVDGSQQFLNGSMSYVAQIDGTAELPTVFGETDATTGEWKIKTTITPSVAWGNNGFLVLKDGNSLTDASPNSNNFTVAGGTLTKTEDCPDNVFSCINGIAQGTYNLTLTTGNNTVYCTDNAWRSAFSTFALSSGKYYFEVKRVGSSAYMWVGIIDQSQLSGTVGISELQTVTRGYAYKASGEKGNSSSVASWGNAYAQNDIVGCALDFDNGKIYFSKNGVWENSGNPESGSTGTGSMYNLASGYDYLIGTSLYSTSAGASFNFGNGYYGTTAVSSAGTNASGNGVFEYDVPTGYTAISTKGLNL